MIKIKPIIRKILESDKLVDVINIAGEQIAVIVRAYPSLLEAKANDGVILDEEFNVQDFLNAKAQALIDVDIQTAKDNAQDAVTKELAKACDGFAYLFEKYVPNMTEGEKSAVKVFRDKYAAWLVLQ